MHRFWLALLLLIACAPQFEAIAPRRVEVCMAPAPDGEFPLTWAALETRVVGVAIDWGVDRLTDIERFPRGDRELLGQLWAMSESGLNRAMNAIGLLGDATDLSRLMALDQSDRRTVGARRAIGFIAARGGPIGDRAFAFLARCADPVWQRDRLGLAAQPTAVFGAAQDCAHALALRRGDDARDALSALAARDHRAAIGDAGYASRFRVAARSAQLRMARLIADCGTIGAAVEAEQRRNTGFRQWVRDFEQAVADLKLTRADFE